MILETLIIVMGCAVPSFVMGYFLGQGIAYYDYKKREKELLTEILKAEKGEKAE